MVDAGDVEQIIERKLIATECRNLAEIARTNRESRLVAKFTLMLNFFAERFA
jgi:hypothetical protein